MMPVVIVAWTAVAALLATVFVIGLMWPTRRRPIIGGLAIAIMGAAACGAWGDWLAMGFILIFGSSLAAILLGFASDLGFVVGKALARVGLRRRRPTDRGKFRRPRRNEDRDALGFTALSLLAPLIVWLGHHSGREAICVGFIGVFYAANWAFAWRRLRPVCRRVRDRAALEARGRAERLCTACGYDLTANASGRCPECGRRVAPRRLVARTAPGTAGAR